MCRKLGSDTMPTGEVLRAACLLIFALAIGSCALARELHVQRVPPIGDVLTGVTVIVPPAVDKRQETLFCSYDDGSHNFIADVSGPLTQMLKLALEDAGVMFVADPQAPFVIRLEMGRLNTAVPCPTHEVGSVRVELSVEIGRHGEKIWSGPVALSGDSAEGAVALAVQKVRDIFIKQVKPESLTSMPAPTAGPGAGGFELEVPQRKRPDTGQRPDERPDPG